MRVKKKQRRPQPQRRTHAPMIGDQIHDEFQIAQALECAVRGLEVLNESERSAVAALAYLHSQRLEAIGKRLIDQPAGKAVA